MFLPKNKDKDSNIVQPANSYMPGVYTTSLVLNDNVVDIEVTVDEANINSIRIVNLDEAVSAMYPLIEPALRLVDPKYAKTSPWTASLIRTITNILLWCFWTPSKHPCKKQKLLQQRAIPQRNSNKDKA